MKARRGRLTDLGTAGLVAQALVAGFAGGTLLDTRVLFGARVNPPAPGRG